MVSPAFATTLRQNTPAWVDARRDYIGSSDLPVITGNTPYGTSVYSLWAIKTRLAEPEPVDEETQELFDLGHALEDDIAERYTARCGVPLRRAMRMLIRKDTPWASASLDRVSAVKGERRIVECKWVPYRSWRDEPEPVPAHVQDQVQWQLWVTGYDVADVAVLLGSKVYRYEIGPNEAYQRDLVYIAHWFRELVQTGTPPPIDGSEATKRALVRLHPSVAVEDILPPTAESDAIADELRTAKAALKVAEEDDGRLRNTLRSLIGEHKGVEGDFYRATWTKNADSAKTDWEAVAKAYRTLLEGLEEHEADVAANAPGNAESQPAASSMADLVESIESLHTTTKEGARVLRVRFRNEETGSWV